MFVDRPEVDQLLAERHWTIDSTIRSDSTSLICKVATEISPELLVLKIVFSNNDRRPMLMRNSRLWTRQIIDNIPDDAPFRVQPIIESGELSGGHYWILSPLLDGTPIVEKSGIGSALVIDNLPQYFPKIASLSNFLAKQNVRDLHGVDRRWGGKSRTDKLALLETLIAWGRNNTPHLSELLQIVSQNYRDLSGSATHGDFTAMNMMIDPQDRVVLLDTEMCSAPRYKYYDVVEFYNRLYTRTHCPELAREFFKCFAKTVPANSQEKFLGNFLSLSAQRCVGNFWEIEGIRGDMVNHNSPSRAAFNEHRKYAEEYAEDIVSFRIIEL